MAKRLYVAVDPELVYELRGLVHFLMSHGDPMATMSEVVDRFIADGLQRDCKKLNQGKPFQPVAVPLRPGRRPGGK